MIKPATNKDIRQLFTFRNLPEAIELSALQRTVSWDEHLTWFNNLSDNKTLLFLIQANAGMVRCDLEDKEVALSIYLKPEHRNKGTALVALNQAIREVLDRWEVHRFVAYTRVDNLVSIKLFSKLGFVKVSTRDEILRMESL